MSGANLDGHSSPKDGIHKQEIQKRIKSLEEEVDILKDLVYQLLTIAELGGNDGR
jgi:hypothetical protein